MNLILFEGDERENLLPLTFMRPVADIRMGISTLREKWELELNTKSSTQTRAYLQEKWPILIKDKNLFLNPSFLPTSNLVNQIKKLNPGERLISNKQTVAYALTYPKDKSPKFKDIKTEEETIKINHPWDIFNKNFDAIKEDFKRVTKGRASAKIPTTFQTFGDSKIFIEEGAKLFSGTLNATDGPIYIGKDAEIREGSHIRGPFALCNGACVQMGSRIYEGTTIGPYSVVGGEIKNTVIFGFSNKGHDGYLGNSVIGEWCNLGADTNNSNLKNNYSTIKLWSYKEERFITTGLQKCGLIMGDHSKAGINTMFNTGTVVGVNANLFGSGFPRNFIPSFSWGGQGKLTTYQLKKALQVAENVMQHANKKLSEVDEAILTQVFEQTTKYRKN